MYRDDEKKYDIRVLEKHFPIDRFGSKEVQVYLDSLPDVSSKTDTDYQFDFTVLPRKSEAQSTVVTPEETKERTEREEDQTLSEQG